MTTCLSTGKLNRRSSITKRRLISMMKGKFNWKRLSSTRTINKI